MLLEGFGPYLEWDQEEKILENNLEMNYNLEILFSRTWFRICRKICPISLEVLAVFGRRAERKSLKHIQYLLRVGLFITRWMFGCLKLQNSPRSDFPVIVSYRRFWPYFARNNSKSVVSKFYPLGSTSNTSPSSPQKLYFVRSDSESVRRKIPDNDFQMIICSDDAFLPGPLFSHVDFFCYFSEPVAENRLSRI